MSTPTPPPTPAPRRRTSTLKMMFWLLLVPIVLIVGYFAVVLNWNYSTGERAGWVQKLSRKGWLCKTWEGEMAMVSMPGAIPEKFLFTVRDDAVAESINKVMGKRVTLHYEEKVGLPTSCFGETRHFVTTVLQVEEMPLAPESWYRTGLRLLQVRRLRLLRRSRPRRHRCRQPPCRRPRPMRPRQRTRRNWRRSAFFSLRLRCAGAHNHFARADESAFSFELTQLMFDLFPRFGTLRFAERAHHLMQRAERFAFKAHAFSRTR